MTALPRMGRELVSEGMFLRPRRPDDHREFEWLLPQMTPLFVYADEEGRDWVRWSMPRHLAEQMGWGARCSVPGCTKEHPSPGEHAFTVDTAYDEVGWFLDGGGEVLAW